MDWGRDRVGIARGWLKDQRVLHGDAVPGVRTYDARCCRKTIGPADHMILPTTNSLVVD